MEIKIMNKEDVIKFLENLKKAKLKGSNIALMDAGFFVQNEVKLSIAGQRSEPTSVDTGRFKNSIDVRRVGTYEVEIFTDIPYAKFLEYGTSKMAPRRHLDRKST